MPLILNEDQIDFYRRNRYLHAKGVIPQDLLHSGKAILESWLDELVDKWFAEGLVKDKRTDLDFQHRLVELWHAAGKPKYNRSPWRELVGIDMFNYLRHPVLVDIASDLLGTTEVSVHGIFNARPKLPDQKWTDTPWHQDAQYFRDEEHVQVISMWVPMQRVTEQNSCLQVAPGYFTDRLLEGVVDEATEFLGLSKEDAKQLKGISIEMDPGDVLIFNQLLPHRALSNKSDAVRWSMDIRFEATPTATESGKKQGFVARSKQNPSSEDTFESWMEKWGGI